MANRKLIVEIVGDASSLEKAMGRATKTSSSFQQGITAASKVAGVALAGLGIAAKIGFDEFNEGQKVAAQTNQVLKTTGGVANVTAKHVDELANSILRKTGIDDEAVKSSENILLAFTKVRNEAGAGNDVFDRAVTVIQDYATRTGKDATQATTAFGKALEDPVGKLGALSKAGVVFDDQQKEQIKTLVKSGDTLGAQKVILDQLEKRYGGAAEAAGKTFSGQVNIAKETAKNFMAELVAGAIPALQKLVSGLSSATQFMQEHERATKIVIGVLAGLAVGVLAVNVAMKAFAAAQAVATAAQWLFNAALTANPIGVVIVALGALGAAIVVAYKHSQTFRDVVSAAFNAVKAVVATVVDVIVGYLNLYLGGLQKIFEAASHIPFVGDKFRGVADAIGSARSELHRLQADIDNLHGKTVDVVTRNITVTEDFHHRASGGRVTAGVPYVVGENRPELFVPDSNGTVLPSVPRMGGGDTYVFNFPDMVAGSQADFERMLTSALKRVNNRGQLLTSDLR